MYCFKFVCSLFFSFSGKAKGRCEHFYNGQLLTWTSLIKNLTCLFHEKFEKENRTSLPPHKETKQYNIITGHPVSPSFKNKNYLKIFDWNMKENIPTTQLNQHTWPFWIYCNLCPNPGPLWDPPVYQLQEKGISRKKMFAGSGGDCDELTKENREC